MATFPRAEAYRPDQGSYSQEPIDNLFFRSKRFANRIVTRTIPGDPRWAFKAGWTDDPDNIRTVQNWLRSYGRGQSFTWYDPMDPDAESAWPDLIVGYGDGSTTTFDIPGDQSSSQSVKIDGVTQASGWSISAGTGTDDRDQVVFISAPADGELITVAATMCRAWTVIITERPEAAAELLSLKVNMESVE